MYLIKKLYTDQKGSVIVENGVPAAQIGSKRYLMVGNFWGKDDVRLGDYCDFDKLKGEEHHLNISYTSTYNCKKYGDGLIDIEFWISAYEPDNIEGYIIFMRHERDIKTDGEKLFGRWPTELVVVLREGNYLEFEGKRVEVINQKLVLYI